MDLFEATKLAVTGNSILFLGAGASWGAKNQAGEQLPMGRALAEELSRRCGLPDDTPLDRVTDIFLEDFGESELVRFLKEKISDCKISKHHSQLALPDWMRVYTTNYDEVYEKSRESVGKKVQTTLLSERPESIPGTNHTCLHINGAIANLDGNSLKSEFKLSTTSYLTQHFHESEWIDTFRTDLRLADSIIFVGYSMYDLDIQRIVFSTKAIKAKTFFVVSRNEREDSVRILGRFGSVEKIGVEYFGQIIQKEVESKPAVKSKMIPFRKWRKPASATSVGRRPTEKDVEDLLLWGTFSPDILQFERRTPDENPYIFKREVVERILSDVSEKGKDVIVHSHLGNGKSILQEELIIRFVEEEFEVFELLDSSSEAHAEGRDILEAATDKTVLIVPSYPACIDMVNDLSAQRPDHVRLVMFSRTSSNDVTFNHLRESLRIRVKEHGVNRLLQSDLPSVCSFFDLYAFWGEYAGRSRHQKERIIKERCNSEVSSLLMMLLKSPNIRSKVEDVVAAFARDRKLMDALIAIMIFNSTGQEFSADTLLDLLDPDLQSKLRRNENQRLRDIIDPEENGIKARSPVSAKFMLQNIFSPDDVARVLIKVAMEAGKRYSYGRVLKELARYSNVQSILPEGEGRRSLAIRFYETTKKITWLNNTPHFWMQYAVARLAFAERDSGQLGFAERYFETAYAKARAIAGYETSMIDNHFARFLFMKAQVDEDAWFALFNEAASILRLQAGSVDERHYPYRVARNVEGVMARYESRMTVEQKEAVLNFCKSMYESSLKLMPNISSHPSVRDFKQRAKKMLARHDVQVE